MNISKHFTLKEMIMSTTAIRLGIDNSPSFEAVTNLMALAENVLEPLREYIGEPIRISSGYRNTELNRKIGGSKSSQHCFGEAADLICNGKNSEMFSYILHHLDFDQLIWEFGDDKEPEWVHVSYKRKGNRRSVLIAKKSGGKTIYERYA